MTDSDQMNADHQDAYAMQLDRLAAATPKPTQVGRYTVRYDDAPECGVYQWEVRDDAGDVWDSFETEAEAIRRAERLEGERLLEDAEERLEVLRADVAELVSDCDDESILATMLNLLIHRTHS